MKVVLSPRPLLALKIVYLDADVVRNSGRLGINATPYRKCVGPDKKEKSHTRYAEPEIDLSRIPLIQVLIGHLYSPNICPCAWA